MERKIKRQEERERKRLFFFIYFYFFHISFIFSYIFIVILYLLIWRICSLTKNYNSKFIAKPSLEQDETLTRYHGSDVQRRGTLKLDSLRLWPNFDWSDIISRCANKISSLFIVKTTRHLHQSMQRQRFYGDPLCFYLFVNYLKSLDGKEERAIN